MRVGFPVGRFSSSGDYDARSRLGPSRFGGNRCREMHGKRNRTKYAGSMIHQLDEIAGAGLSDEVNHATKLWVPVSEFPDLKKR